MNSREKGKRGEREWAQYLTANGFQARRGQQYNGVEGRDVVCDDLPGFHFEVKRTERLSLYDAVDQAKRDAGADLACVAHKRNRHEWVVIMPADDFLTLVREAI